MQGSARIGAGLVACLLAVAALLWPGVGWGASRVALVVGNSGYAGTPLPKLRNAVNDAELMARTLQTVGFKVTLVTDADQAKMKEAIKAFGKQLVRAGQDAVGLFFYAGHGAEATSHSYLIPIGADLEAVMDYQTDAVPAEWVLSRMGAAGNRVNVVILDACRDNRLPAAYRSGGVGVARIPAPSGTLIAYSAAPNQQALDGDGDHSPYAEQLARFIVEPGLKVEDVFKRVGAAVEKNTGGEQSPWKENSLRTDFYFVAKAEEPPSPKPVPKTVVKTGPPEQTRQQLAARAYEAAERVNTPPAYRLIVEQYPGTLYAKLAKEQIGKLERAMTLSAGKAEASLGLKLAERERIQKGLKAMGFDPGVPDGTLGRNTRNAIQAWQRKTGHADTGYLTRNQANNILSEVPLSAVLRPKCAELRGQYIGKRHTECWDEIANRSGCYWWNSHYHSDRATKWSGRCRNGIAEGTGTLAFTSGSEHTSGEGTGTLAMGRSIGRWTVKSTSGDRYDGQIRNGKFHGQGTSSLANGTMYEGEWRNHMKHGDGTKKYKSGSRYEGKWKDNKPHGRGVYTRYDGRVYKGVWTKGCLWKKNGRWAGLETTKKACGFDVKTRLMKVSLTRSFYGNEARNWNVTSTTRFRANSISSRTPTKHALADTIRTKALHRLIIDSLPPVALVDVIGGDGHHTLPGAVWLKGAGLAHGRHGDIERRLAAALNKITNGDKVRRLVFFCRGAECWLSYNAALRAVALGYKNVYWYRGGVTAWEAAKLPTEKAVRTEW